MKRCTMTATMMLLAALNVGCVERRFVITSDPPGALVYRNGVPIGTTPCDDHFVYYGKYRFTLVREKFAPLEVIEDVKMPWYEIPGIDFVSENVFPCKIRDVRRLHYALPPLVPDNPQDVLAGGIKLRDRGKTIGTPAPQRPTPGQPPPPGVDPLLPPSQQPVPGVPGPLPQGPPGTPASLPGGTDDPRLRQGEPGGVPPLR